MVLDADLTRLAQVFANLLTNSAKYTEKGGRIWLTAARDGAEVVVTVRDTGIGIPADMLDRIFDMFSQVDRSIERATGGLGIGLALVKGLVEMHGGTVAAASEGPRLGSVLTVRLPAIPNPETSPAGQPAGAAPGSRVDGCSSWTTTGTERSRWPRCCDCWATRRTPRTTGWRRSRPRRGFGPT